MGVGVALGPCNAGVPSPGTGVGSGVAPAARVVNMHSRLQNGMRFPILLRRGQLRYPTRRTCTGAAKCASMLSRPISAWQNTHAHVQYTHAQEQPRARNSLCSHNRSNMASTVAGGHHNVSSRKMGRIRVVVGRSSRTTPDGTPQCAAWQAQGAQSGTRTFGPTQGSARCS